MSGTVTTTPPILLPVAAAADAALCPSLAATSAAQIANTSAIAGQAAVLPASAILPVEISSATEAAATVSALSETNVAKVVEAAAANDVRTSAGTETVGCTASYEEARPAGSRTASGPSPSAQTTDNSPNVMAVLLPESPTAIVADVISGNKDVQAICRKIAAAAHRQLITENKKRAKAARAKTAASRAASSRQRKNSESDSVAVISKPKVMRGARQAHSGRVLGHRIDPKKAALGIFEIRRQAVPEKFSPSVSRTQERTSIPEQTRARNLGHTHPADTVIGENFVRTLKPNTHVVVRATLGGVPIFQHFVVRNGELEFAGWEIISSDTNSADALGTPAAISWANIEASRPNIFAFGLPGGETALRQDYIADVNAQIGEELASRILAQIKSGPKSLENSIQLAAFNSYLRTNGYMTPSTRVTAKDWELLVRETLRLALRHVHAIDENGARSVSSIRADAAKVIGINRQTVALWGTHFNADFVALQLAASDEVGSENARPLNLAQSLVLALEERIGSLAAGKIALPKSEFGVTAAAQTALSWQATRLSLIADTNRKVEAAKNLIAGIFEERGRIYAALALAMIIKNAALNDDASAKEAVAPRWSKSDAAALVKALSNGPAWEAVSHRAFRGELSVEANAWVNEALASVRATLHDDVLDIDVTQVDADAFFDALEASGRADEVMLAALLKMGLMAAQSHKGAASRESYS